MVYKNIPDLQKGNNMKSGFTTIAAVLDASGSMASLIKDTLDGFNNFVEEQRQVPGEATLTLCTFNNSNKVIHEFLPLKDVPLLTKDTYQPNGGTALLDAVGHTVTSLGAHLAKMKEEDRPSKVILMVVTDGAENASKNFTREKVKEMLEHQQSKYNWEVIFAGANIDSFEAGSSMGIRRAGIMNYAATPQGVTSNYQNVSKAVRRSRISP